MRFAWFSAALVATACLHVSASAQDVSRERSFVEQIAFNSGDNNGLARWNDRICVGAAGLDAATAQALVDRISARAQAVGLRPGAPGCQANVMVIYAPDSDVVTRQIVDQRRDLLGFYGDDGRITAGQEAMEDFANSPRAIRWWHISSTGVGSMRPDSARARQSSAAAGAGARAGRGDMSGQSTTEDLEGAEAVRVGGTRARQEVRNDLTYALIVVDARRVAGVSADAWIDYVTFAALAQLDPGASTSSYPTVLNLFTSAATPPTGLTAWDTAYLDALYDVRRERSNRQISAIARRVSEAGQ